MGPKLASQILFGGGGAQALALCPWGWYTCTLYISESVAVCHQFSSSKMYHITISAIVVLVLFGAYITCQESEENCLEGYYTDSDVKGPPSNYKIVILA